MREKTPPVGFEPTTWLRHKHRHGQTKVSSGPTHNNNNATTLAFLQSSSPVEEEEEEEEEEGEMGRGSSWKRLPIHGPSVPDAGITIRQSKYTGKNRSNSAGLWRNKVQMQAAHHHAQHLPLSPYSSFPRAMPCHAMPCHALVQQMQQHASSIYSKNKEGDEKTN
ncbi:hypothetical protein LSM04_006201 [Trypanosoma melophagium]|uniref:uncharacterized protein n=1 Tax=Trypanosoma melophagium TaxID=715481 RepID=UPI00351A73B9|nr:hypothetical protein LSM04_006201 [Trypanosoma melophagium]